MQLPVSLILIPLFLTVSFFLVTFFPVLCYFFPVTFFLFLFVLLLFFVFLSLWFFVIFFPITFFPVSFFCFFFSCYFLSYNRCLQPRTDTLVSGLESWYQLHVSGSQQSFLFISWQCFSTIQGFFLQHFFKVTSGHSLEKCSCAVCWSVFWFGWWNPWFVYISWQNI